MTVANATYETRTSWGAGDFAYSACTLSARALFHASASPVFCAGGDLSTSLSALSVLSSAFASSNVSMHAISCWSESQRFLSGACSFRDRTKHLMASAEALTSAGRVTLSVLSKDSSGARFISLPTEPLSRFDAGHIRVAGMLYAPGWRFLPNSAATLTVSAPWFFAHARYTVYDSAPCRRDTRRFCRGGFAFQVGRALRL